MIYWTYNKELQCICVKMDLHGIMDMGISIHPRKPDKHLCVCEYRVVVNNNKKRRVLTLLLLLLNRVPRE